MKYKVRKKKISSQDSVDHPLPFIRYKNTKRGRDGRGKVSFFLRFGKSSFGGRFMSINAIDAPLGRLLIVFYV